LAEEPRAGQATELRASAPVTHMHR
jgi:hypothetical protein